MEYEELRRGGDPIITLYLHFIPRLEYSESFRGQSGVLLGSLHR